MVAHAVAETRDMTSAEKEDRNAGVDCRRNASCPSVPFGKASYCGVNR